jgi:chitinase
VLLSVGGWGSGGFSEMAADEKKRKAFAKSCLKAIKDYNLDGIDIDWEYPTKDVAGISASPNDSENFTLLMRDLRDAIGKDRLLTLATICSAHFIHFRNIINYVDYVNIMAYDMASPPLHHAALYKTKLSGKYTSETSVNAHLAAGVPKEKLVMGMPFYGQGTMKLPKHRDIEKFKVDSGLTEQWDDVGKFPYLIDKDGKVVYTYENTRSLAEKCKFIKSKDLRGAMYWECGYDNQYNDLSRTVYEGIIK